ncbi:MAG: hypothetical protein LBQ68_05075, partial [Clostridiales bacterium]|nr:hypothetical protein [Clostridiales bacterium]
MDDRNREHDFDDTEEIFDDDFEVAPRRAYKRPTGRKPPTRNYATFYIITLVVAVIISMVIFAAVYNNITSEKKPSGSVAATDLPSPSADESFVASVDRVTCIGVITLLDLTAKKVEVLDVSNNAPYSLFITEGSRLQEKSGTPLLLNEFALGDIIEAEYNKNNGQVVTFSKSATAWTIPERDKVSVDLMTKIIRVDNDVYNFNDNLVALYNGERFSPDRIKPVDVITISGVATQAWSIILLKGHGTLMISDIEHIRNGVLEVDNEVYQTLDKTEPIYLSEGEHKIVIRGDNIDSYTKEVVIEANESEIVSLTDAPIKTGLISINTNVTEYRLFIDDSEYPLGEPI